MRNILKELGLFFRRDFQDYSRQDYGNLSRGTRFILLFFIMVLLIVGLFIAWRYFYESDKQQQIARTRAGLQSRITLLREEIDELQQFLMRDDFQALTETVESFVEKGGALHDRGRDWVSERERIDTALLHSVTAQLISDGLILFSMKPQREGLWLKREQEMPVRQPQKMSASRRAQSQSATQMLLRSSYLRLSDLFTEGPFSTSGLSQQEAFDVERMSLTLNVCGHYAALMTFLGNIAHDKQWIVESQQIVEVPALQAQECRETPFLVILHFYPLVPTRGLLTLQLPALSTFNHLQNAGMPINRFPLPHTMMALRHYLETQGSGIITRLHQAQAQARDKARYTTFDLPFLAPKWGEKTIEDDQSRGESASYLWRVGTAHKGMTLRGIVQIDARYLLLIAQGKGEMRLLSIDDLPFNIVKIELDGVKIILGD